MDQKWLVSAMFCWSTLMPRCEAQRQALIDYVMNNLIPAATAVSTDPRYTQTALSERLANAGVLPMFGFPTRIRFLHHERPRRAYPWPPEDVIDRELDIAISQFAPGAETVKDGLIHTAIGVVNYRPQGQQHYVRCLGHLDRSSQLAYARAVGL